MKKLLGLLLLLVFTMTGCVAMETSRGVQKNTFYSTYPELAIEFEPEFEYIDKSKSNDFGFFYGRESGTVENSELFVFGDRLTRTTVLIKITRIGQGYWLPQLNSGIRGLISSGYEEHNGTRYQYGVWTAKDSDDRLSMVKRSARVVGARSDTLLQIFYIEPLKGDDQTLDGWQKADMLTIPKQKALNNFIKNSTKRMKFIDLSSLQLEGV